MLEYEILQNNLGDVQTPIVCVCPTYRRPELLKNSVFLFLKQTVKTPSTLLIFDDGVNFEETTLRSGNKLVILKTFNQRFPTLGHKYNSLVETAVKDLNAKYIFIWEDDDVYLPEYIESYMSCFNKGANWVKTENVKTYFKANLATTYGATSYFASLAFTRQAYDLGLRFVEDGEDTFDIRFMNGLRNTYGSFCDPTKQQNPKWGVYYIFRWDTTRNYHGQGYMRGTKNTWYEIVGKITKQPTTREGLKPVLDKDTEVLLKAVE